MMVMVMVMVMMMMKMMNCSRLCGIYLLALVNLCSVTFSALVCVDSNRTGPCRDFFSHIASWTNPEVFPLSNSKFLPGSSWQEFSVSTNCPNYKRVKLEEGKQIVHENITFRKICSHLQQFHDNSKIQTIPFNSALSISVIPPL
jgi:hypothetical protein